jgi:DNA polymerase V
MQKKSNLGGFRPGSGRPKGTGKYREPTEPLRVPRSLLPQVKDLLNYYLEEREGASLEDSEFATPITAGNVKPFTNKSAVRSHYAVANSNYAVTNANASISSKSARHSHTPPASHMPHPTTVFPLYATRVAAGFPSPADDHIEVKLDLNQHLVKHPASTFFVRVEGESMIGAGIYPNDILVVDRSLKPGNGKVVIAVVNGELTVKRLKVGKGSLTLLAENVKYPSIQITEEMNFSIWGVVTNVIHSL